MYESGFGALNLYRLKKAKICIGYTQSVPRSMSVILRTA